MIEDQRRWQIDAFESLHELVPEGDARQAVHAIVHERAVLHYHVLLGDCILGNLKHLVEDCVKVKGWLDLGLCSRRSRCWSRCLYACLWSFSSFVLFWAFLQLLDEVLGPLLASAIIDLLEQQEALLSSRNAFFFLAAHRIWLHTQEQCGRCFLLVSQLSVQIGCLVDNLYRFFGIFSRNLSLEHQEENCGFVLFALPQFPYISGPLTNPDG
mmetsp:Transcript_161945/g.295675  ORF Transcript_161945/g.295675 Transcript_161945/m.295675 type:complete len:212 (-) Transcript_161945:1453-2088(-)